MKVEYIPIRVPVQKGRFDLLKVLIKAVENNGEELQDGDIIVISSKFMALSEGRLLKLDRVNPRPQAHKLADSLHMSSRLAELVLREADYIFGGVPGFALAIKDGLIAPNAGVDRSNVQRGWVILYPADSFREAEIVRRKILLYKGRKVGIVITDSRLMPTRIGTSGQAIGVAGFEPVKDERGRKDLFGNVLRVTLRAIADDICAGAQLLMGETDESIPVVIVRNSGVELCDRPIGKDEIVVDHDECIYVRGLYDRSLGYDLLKMHD